MMRERGGVRMREQIQELSLTLTVGEMEIQVLNLLYEEFHRTIPSHAHGAGCYELHYIASGRGSAWVAGREYAIGSGTFFVTGPLVIHAQAPDPEDPMQEYCLYLKLERRRGSGGEAGDTGRLLALLEETVFWFGTDTQGMLPLVRGLFQAARLRRPGYILEMQSLLGQILVAAVRNYREEGARGPQEAASPSGERTAVLIEDYFLYEYQQLSLQELSQRLHLSPRQTERLLKERYGKTFSQKKAEARMSAAAELLRYSAGSVTAIAEELGYGSIEHFSSAFRRYFGETPTAYRRRSRR